VKGHTGGAPIVDLTSNTGHEEDVPEEIHERYLSGIDLAVHFSTGPIPVGAGPLGPDDLHGFVSGVLTGTSALFSGQQVWLAHVLRDGNIAVVVYRSGGVNPFKDNRGGVHG
jgi:aldehyde:ferredoxin oxidoreductase